MKTGNTIKDKDKIKKEKTNLPDLINEPPVYVLYTVYFIINTVRCTVPHRTTLC